ncbi:MAG: MCE family protein [Actinomycetota bacterium]|nr:MCE family protein [Actinomycetota bacterium]MDQ3951908.1 MCE family protein [Actinomycetota bacterium]
MRRLVRAIALMLVAATASSCALFRTDPSPEVVAYFRDVGDLVEKGTVQVADVEVGSVQEIDLVTEGGEMLARVTISIDEGEKIPAEGLRAVVRQTSLLGEQFVELVPGPQAPPYIDSPPAPAQVTIPVERTDRIVDIETFLGDVSAFVGGGGLEDLNSFTHAQALILEDRGRRFGETIEELERFTSVLAGRRFDIEAAIEGLASAGSTLAANRDTLGSFLDSLEDANALLAEQGDDLRRLFSSLSRFGSVNARFLARHEDAINRQFRALRPILGGLAGAQGELRVDIAQLRTFFELFPKSMGGGPHGTGKGDYIQAEAVLCEALSACSTKGEKGDVPGEGT